MTRWPILLLAALPGVPSGLQSAELDVPPAVVTIKDGRPDIRDLYTAFAGLADRGWIIDVIVHSQPDGVATALPVIALRSPARGSATWVISGIHGEEPAGPAAIAASIEAIAEFGAQHPMVVLPLTNPHGYARNWRYLNSPVWSSDIASQSVGDSSHLLPDPADPGIARAAAASSPEADAITAYIRTMQTEYPALVSIDLHEDNLLERGYVYSQGTAGAADPMATAAVRVLLNQGIPLQLEGSTRFDETIVDGIIGPVADSSIDELMSAAQLVLDGKVVPGPAARSVLVFETPAGVLPLERRIDAHAALLGRMLQMISADPD